MPILQYLFGVGGALLCLMFLLNAYVPAAPPREQRQIDKSIIHVHAAPTGDFVIDHFPVVRGDLADAANDAVKKAMAMIPPEDTKLASDAVRTESPLPPAQRKRRVAQRPQPRVASSARSQPSSNGGWSNTWPNDPGSSNSGGWNTSWSQDWSNDRWANNR